MPQPKLVCKHCAKRARWRRRGLCWKCYADPKIRRQYRASFGGPAIACGRDCASEPPSPGPLPGQPGSEVRVMELGRRYDRRVGLWGPPPGAGTGGEGSAPAGVPLDRVAALFGVSVQSP